VATWAQTSKGVVLALTCAAPSREDDGGDKPARRPKRVFVFCRHQVDRAH
jgi:hypothetical protein